LEKTNDDQQFKRNYFRIALEYAWSAKRDKKRKKYCKWVRLAAIRFIRDLERIENDPDCPFYFDEWEANNPCDFIEELPHVEGVWDDPTIVLEPWQIFNTVNMFGFRRVSDSYRRFNTAYIEVGRKNAKSTWAAGVALYTECCEGENGPQCYTAATTGKQARIVFNVAKKMVERTPDIVEAFNLNPMASSVVCHDNGGFLQPINSKASTQDGLNPHFALLDELHAHPNRELFDVLKSARGARKNPLSMYITTAGYNNLGVCYEQRTIVTKILQGVIKGDHYYGIIYTIDEDDDEFDENCWIKPNPNLDVSVQRNELRGYADEARISPDSLGEYKTKRLNVWTTAKGAWINIHTWAKCQSQINIEDLLELPCYAGLDLAATQDFNAFVLLWEIEKQVIVYPRFYLPEEIVKPRTERGNVPFQTWASQGHILLTPGNVTDYAYIEKDVKEHLGKFDIKSIGYDEWNATDLVNRLVEEEAPLVGFRQGPKSFHPPMQDFERRYASSKFTHGNNPVLNWMASNLVARRDVNENMAPDRKNSQEKIDGMVAMLMAWGLMLGPEEDKTPEVVVL